MSQPVQQLAQAPTPYRKLLSEIRGWEIEHIVAFLRDADRVLEIGAGTGDQAHRMAELGIHVEAVELASSQYADGRVFPVKDYDGRTLPFADGVFDAVFSSNVLEHVPDLSRMHSEIARVLKSDGIAVHVLPTHAWRFWTTLSAVPGDAAAAWANARAAYSERRSLLDGLRAVKASFRQERHGERGNLLTETWYFRPEWWRRNFRDNGFALSTDRPMGLFYTGNLLLGGRLSLKARAVLSRLLGSACHIFVLRPLHETGRAIRSGQV